MKKAIQFSFITLFAICSSVVSAQSMDEDQFYSENEPKVRPFRIGGKLGFPNLIGGNVEYVTPLLGDKLAVSADYSTISTDWIVPEEEEGYESSGDKLDFSYIEGGLNYYLFRPGSGLYVGASYGNIKIEGQMVRYSTESDRTEPGTGDIDFANGSFNLKLGAKLGGLFYFRPEVGYRFSALPESYDMEVVFDDGYTETQSYTFDTESSPQNLLYKGLIANIGLGFAF
ncbi:hypothetical protein RM545_03815 [Zunongwangia sp. F260]|uniref:Outer membrane protein beta-barrel domain-containing protein n=1 Tax=Autumnicola lenta TaxID=3075593 RepID=A0ABU3CHI2_9FLAO|nr:hypothetical protein [Zunongwangia sp. F260]MDT0645804.1 hypothetical protein [Zunongwangia sp. F260]